MAELLTSVREADETLSESPKHQAIVETATELFLEAGYGAVSMDATAARAGVSKRTVYSHFPGKDVLFGAVMGNVGVVVVGMRAPAQLTSGPLRQVLTDYGRTFLTLITSPQALAIFRVVTAEAARFPELGEVFYRTGPERCTNTLAHYLREQDRAGTLRVPDPQSASAQFLAMVKGPVHMRLTLCVGERPSAQELEAVVDSAVEAFLRAYRCSEAL